MKALLKQAQARPFARLTAPGVTRPSFISRLRLLIVEIFQHLKRHFLLAVMADDALEIPAVLNAWQLPARRTEVAQNPRRAAGEAGDFFQHRQRAAIKIRLILLAETRQRIGMKTLLGVRAIFADENRFG